MYNYYSPQLNFSLQTFLKLQNTTNKVKLTAAFDEWSKHIHDNLSNLSSSKHIHDNLSNVSSSKHIHDNLSKLSSSKHIHYNPSDTTLLGCRNNRGGCDDLCFAFPHDRMCGCGGDGKRMTHCAPANMRCEDNYCHQDSWCTVADDSESCRYSLSFVLTSLPPPLSSPVYTLPVFTSLPPPLFWPVYLIQVVLTLSSLISGVGLVILEISVTWRSALIIVLPSTPRATSTHCLTWNTAASLMVIWTCSNTCVHQTTLSFYKT